jgi:hypothetical protein
LIWAWVLFAACVASAYPAFVILRPSAAIRVQVGATQKRDGWRRRIGEGTQRLLQIEPTLTPWNDRGAQRRVRLFGLAELVVIWGVALPLLALVD